MRDKAYLAFDFGAGSGRAIVGKITHGHLKLEEIHRFDNTPILQDGHIRWNLTHLQEAVRQALSIAIEKYDNLTAIAVDTWGVDFGLLDDKGHLLELPVTYRDSRTDGMIDQVYQQISPEQLYQLTGNQAAPINSLFQLRSIQKTNPKLLKTADSLLFMPDLFNYFLTGKKYTEYTIASTAQLLNPDNKQWESTLFEQLNLPISLMNPIKFPGETIGPLCRELASDKKIDVIAVGSHDTASAVAAIPLKNNRSAFLSSGTWSLIGREIDKPVKTAAAMKTGFTNEGGVNQKIRFLQNVMGMWLLEESRKIWQSDGHDTDYDTLLNEAEKAPSLGIYLDPDHSGFFNPDNMINAINNYCRANHYPIPQNPAQYTRTILESLAEKYLRVINQLNEFTTPPVETLHIVGGGSQNRLLNQLTADKTGLPVVAGPVEATAIGNIMLQAIAIGDVENLEAARQIVHDSFNVTVYSPGS